MALVLISTSAIFVAGIAIAVRNPAVSAAEQFRLTGRDCIAMSASLAWSVVVFIVLRTEIRSPWATHLPWHVLVAILIFLATTGVLAAYLGRGRVFLVPVAVAIQAFIIFVVLVAPFGFDKQSSWGLGFGHLILLLAAFLMSFAVGMLVALLNRWTGAAWLQLGLLLAGVCAVVISEG